MFVCIHDFESDKAQRVEVDEMLRTMLEFEQNGSRKDSTQIALVAHCLAMLWFLAGDSVKVSDQIRHQALKVQFDTVTQLPISPMF